MNITLLEGLDGARRARGTAIVIDVLRACTTACCLVERGARAILAANGIGQARRLSRALPDALLVGERDGIKPADFDHGNSPGEILGADVAGRTAVLATSAGTRGLHAAAAGADTVLTGAFVNARAIVDRVRTEAPGTVSIVSLGLAGLEPTVEDTLCARWLKAGLLGEPQDFAAVVEAVRSSPSGAKFRDSAQPWFPPADLDLCLELDRFDVVLRVEIGDDGALRLV